MIYKRMLSVICATVMTVAALGGTAHAADEEQAVQVQVAAALPVVDMAAVEVAANVEGKYRNRPKIGDDPSTRLIQKALTAKGFRTTVDGWYGAQTTKAYADYQRSLGFKGIDANGLPGRTSLTKLGAGRFTIKNAVTVGSRTAEYGGKRVNERTKKMLAAADEKVSWTFKLTQGSYNPGGVDGSSGTHDGGGAVDLDISGLSQTQVWQTVKALRSVGFAAWYRPETSSWGRHIHGIAIGDPDLWQRNGEYTNRYQVGDYYVGDAGLAGDQKDNTPKEYQVDFTWWEKYSKDDDSGGDPGDNRTSPEDLRASQPALDYIADKEGFKAEPYDDPGGKCTIGYGHLIAQRACTEEDRERFGRWTEEQAMNQLREDVEEKAADLRDLIPRTPLHQREFDALLSLVFNIGAGGDGGPKDTELHEALLADPPRYENVPEHLLAFVNVGSEPVCGLYLRRVEEGKIFADGSYTWRAEEDSCPPEYRG